MSNKPFDRTIIRPLEKPLADDINQLETNFDQTLRFFIKTLLTNPETGTPFDGFLDAGLLVSAASLPDMTVTVAPGLGFQVQTGTEVAIDSVPGLNDLDTYKPIPLLNPQVFTVPAAPTAPNTRIDIIEVRAESLATDPTTRQVFNETLGQFVPGTVKKTLAWALDGRAAVAHAPSPSTAVLSYLVGQGNNPGVAPPTTPGYIKIAEIAVGSDVVTIVSANISDFRESLSERVFRIHWPAAGGFNLTGTTTVSQDGSVLVNAGGGWAVVIGAGLEAGDIVEDFVVVLEKTNSTSNNLETTLTINNVDLDTLASPTSSQPSFANTGAQTVQKLYTVSHAASVPGAYPFEWEPGFGGSMQFLSNLANDRIHSVYAVVRRTINKRDS